MGLPIRSRAASVDTSGADPSRSGLRHGPCRARHGFSKDEDVSHIGRISSMRKQIIGLSAIFIVALAMMPGQASSHREAPLSAMDPTADNTDVYAFVSPDEPDKVTLISNFIPFQAPNGGPNFYPFDPNVVYAIHIDNNGDAVEDIT